VADLTDQHYYPGEHSVEWNGRDSAGRAVPSGEYFFRVDMDGRVETRKALLLNKCMCFDVAELISSYVT